MVNQDTVKAMEKRGFKVRVFDSRQQVKETLLNEIPSDATIGIGGSVTVQELEVENVFRERGNSVYWHWRVTPEERIATTKAAYEADYYLMSANAITADGAIYNIDGTGNRIGTMIFGLGKLIIIAGENKITDGDPIERIKSIACPKNAVRLNLSTPCALTGKCNDCSSPQRMCKVTSVLDNPPNGRDMEVWLVNESMGY